MAFSTIINLNFENFDKAAWLKIVLLIGLAFKRYLVPSASPDMIVYALELIIIGTLIEYIFSQKKNNDNLTFILLVLCFIFYFKISSIIFCFLFMMIIIYFYKEEIIKIVNFKIIIFILLPFLVWILRGYILSGMPFYPNSFLSINHLAFSTTKEYADAMTIYMYNWSVNKNIISDVKISFRENFFYWFKNFLFYQKLYIGILFSLLTMILLNFKKEIFSKIFIVIFIALIANISFVLINLPQARFLESSLIGLILLLIIFFYKTYKKISLINNIILDKIIMICSTVFFILIVFYKGEFNNTFSLNWNSSNVLESQNFKKI